jgi:hypothetical protein
LELKLQGFKIRKLMFKLAPKESPVFLKKSKLRLEVLLKKKNCTTLVPTSMD